MESVSPMLVAQHLLLICAIVLGTGACGAYVAARLRIPDVVLFLVTGLALGSAGAGLIDISSGSAANQLIVLFGASYILFDGGAVMRLSVLKNVWLTIALLATLGVAVTTAVVGVAIHMVLGLPVIVALLAASVIASTDPASLVPMFRQFKVRERLKQTVIAESACNDAIGAILTFSLLALVSGGSVSVLEAGGNFLWQALIGIVVGAAAGYGTCVAIAHEHLSFLRESLPLATLLVVAAAVLAADHYQASGFMAVFIAGAIIGNKQMFGFAMAAEEERLMDDFVATTGLLMRMFIFILLGAQANLALLREYALPAVGIALVLMLVARPIVVLLCVVPDRRAKWTFQELLFLCWTRETGVIPAALSSMLVGAGAPHADVIAAVTGMAILTTILLQATTTPWLARRLNLLERQN